jgi:4-phosphopantoate--beta-alanine ligase
VSFSLPENHPRYKSLLARHLLEEGVKSGITTMTGLVAQGRGEAFDYLLGEKTHDFADEACQVAAAMMVLAELPVISVNGNTAMLVTDEFVALSRTSCAPLEINLFHDAPERRDLIAERFRNVGLEMFGVRPDSFIAGLTSDRAKVDSRGIFKADVVLVSLEDGDRTEFLIQGGKKVIAIDLNPMSRTPQKSTVPIIDNVQRAIPLIETHFKKLSKRPESELVLLINSFDKTSILKRAEAAIRGGSL